MESPVNYTYNLPPEDDENQEILDMADSVRAVEKLLNYNFADKKLLEEALTHSSYTGSASYQRLEFVGDSALGLAITNYIFLAYPEVDPGKLSLVRASNISTEKLARVAIRHGLYKYVRHNATALDEKVMEFAIAIQEEDDAEVHGGLMKAPKVLADIVESVAAAVYVDSNFNLKDMWMVIRDLLEPIVTLDMVEQQPQPVTMLFELCQKDGKQVDIRHWRKGERNVASVYVDGYFVASASAEQKENAKLHAAKAALRKLSYKSSDMMGTDIFSELNGEMEIEGAKQKLHELCGKKKWPRPDYKVDREVGRSHEKKYVCSVQIKINESVLLSTGNEKTRIRDAENSAASAMLYGLRESKCGNCMDMKISWTDANPAKRFFVCEENHCTCFAWYDPPICDRAKQVIPGLLNSGRRDETKINKLEAHDKKLELEIKKLEADIKCLEEEKIQLETITNNTVLVEKRKLGSSYFWIFVVVIGIIVGWMFLGQCKPVLG